MFSLLQDDLSKKTVIFAPQRLDRFSKTECPFCPGNENLSPTEVFRIGKGEPNSKNWSVRVVANKFPISEFHEVVIHSPSETALHHLSNEEITNVFKVFKERYLYYHQLGQVVIFSNQGESSGATIKHQHSQIVVLPHKVEIDILPKQKISNIIEEVGSITSYCPEFSQHPYEVHITSQTNNGRFGSLSIEELKDLSLIFKNTVSALEKILKENRQPNELSYNFFISPVENWYLRIIPRIYLFGGFELATNMSINLTLPKEAHERYKKALGQEIVSEVGEIKSTNVKHAKHKEGEPDIDVVVKIEKPKTEKERISDILGKLGSF